MHTVTLSWETAHLYNDLWVAHHRLRHRIFVERLKWDVKSHNGLEYDEFDTPTAHYVICIKDSKQVCGITRLLPTTQPYMVQKLWPDWYRGDVPVQNNIWEATRFGCCATLTENERRQAVASLISSSLRFGLKNDISSYLAVMPMQIYKRVLIPAGCDLEVISEPRRIGVLNCAIAEIEISQKTLNAVEEYGRQHRMRARKVNMMDITPIPAIKINEDLHG